MPLDLAVQQQLINSIADHPDWSLSMNMGPEETPVAYNLRYLLEAGVVAPAIGASANDGSRYAQVTFTPEGQVFAKGQSEGEAFWKIKIKERISQLLDLTATERQNIQHAVEQLPWGLHSHVGLRLVDMGLSADAEARAAAVKYLKGL